MSGQSVIARQGTPITGTVPDGQRFADAQVALFAIRRARRVPLAALAIYVGWLGRDERNIDAEYGLGYALGIVGGVADADPAAVLGPQARPLAGALRRDAALVPDPHDARHHRAGADSLSLQFRARRSQFQGGAVLHAPGCRQRRGGSLPLRGHSPWSVWQQDHAEGTRRYSREVDRRRAGERADRADPRGAEGARPARAHARPSPSRTAWCVISRSPGRPGAATGAW